MPNLLGNKSAVRCCGCSHDIKLRLAALTHFEIPLAKKFHGAPSLQRVQEIYRCFIQNWARCLLLAAGLRRQSVSARVRAANDLVVAGQLFSLRFSLP